MKDHQLNIKPIVLWFTGLSGAGKSTLSQALSRELCALGARTFVLDGDILRQGLCRDLGFSKEDRRENIRRAGEVARMLVDSGVLTLAAFITPFEKDRLALRSLFEQGSYFEIFCDSSLEVCERRDKKKLYQKARAGVIADFTGIDSPFETPTQPDLILNTSSDSLDTCTQQLVEFLLSRKIIDKLSLKKVGRRVHEFV